MASNPLENFIHHTFRVAARVEFEPLNDKQLLQRYVEQRDQLAFGEVARRHGKMVWQVCWHTLGHRQDAEDAFQATFMTLIRRAPSILWRESIDGWLHHVACQIATKVKIRRSQQQTREERRAAMCKGDYMDPANERELGEVLDKELDRLPEKYRSPLILCYLEGLTQEQAAKRMNIPLRTFARQLAEGKERLRARLSGRGMELDTAMLLPGLSSDANLPSGLVEKTLDMARILTLSNGTLGTAGISPQVAALAKGGIGTWTMKVKICLGITLLALGGVGTGMARYPGFFLQLIRGDQPKETKPDPDNKKVDESQANEAPLRTDLYGDALPPGVIHRLGTVRFRNNTDGFGLVITPDAKNPMIVCRSGDSRLPFRFWDCYGTLSAVDVCHTPAPYPLHPLV